MVNSFALISDGRVKMLNLSKKAMFQAGMGR
jgi:hypothetical protein